MENVIPIISLSISAIVATMQFLNFRKSRNDDSKKQFEQQVSRLQSAINSKASTAYLDKLLTDMIQFNTAIQTIRIDLAVIKNNSTRDASDFDKLEAKLDRIESELWEHL